jgi:hypothetical protein
LYFHANAEDLGTSYHFLREVGASLEVSTLAMEYLGYGLYQGEPDEEKILVDALHVYDFITTKLGVA